MRIIATLLFLLPGVAFAECDDFMCFTLFVTSAGTTALTQVTSNDAKRVSAIQHDASSFVASDGAIRGIFLEAALRQARAATPGLQAGDMALAMAILAAIE